MATVILDIEEYNALVKGNDAPAQNEVHFTYDGIERVVVNPQITKGAYSYLRNDYNTLLSGVETYRDGEESGEYKHFNLRKIQYS